MIGAAALAEKAAAGLGMSTARVEGPAQFQAAPKVAFGRLIEYEPGRAAKAPNYTDLVRPMTMRGAGESFDLEREETLGDSFLKYWTSLKLYLCEKESLDEGALTTKRSRLIGNKNLFECGRRLGLPDVVTHEKFEPQRNWRPPLFRCNGDVEKLLVELDTDYRHGHICQVVFSRPLSNQVVHFQGQTPAERAHPLPRAESGRRRGAPRDCGCGG